MGEIERYLASNIQASLGFFISWILPFVIVFGAIWLGYYIHKSRKQPDIKAKPYEKSESLTDTLTAMHRRLIELQKEKASHTRVSLKQLDKASWIFLNRFGLVPLRDRQKFLLEMKRRIRKGIHRPPFRRSLRVTFIQWAEYRARIRERGITVGLEMQRELIASRKWELADAVRAGVWLDDFGWGVKRMRDNDQRWSYMWKSISDFLRDGTLRKLIDEHIDLSYAYNNVSLMGHYSEKLGRHGSFLTELHAALVGSGISPEKAELVLGEVLEQIDKRLQVLNNPLYNSVAVKPIAGKRKADYERTEHTMWAELQITNTGRKELEDVQVNIAKCLTLQRKQDSTNQNDIVMFDHLNLKPFCVYWSERQTAQPKQMNLVIPKNATRSALIAFQDNSNGGQFNFNSHNYEWIVGGVKIDVEISSHEAIIWNCSYYIECHPNYAGKTLADYKPSKFEFVEWDMWARDKHIILLNSDK
jgi:hypothetical protein